MGWRLGRLLRVTTAALILSSALAVEASARDAGGICVRFEVRAEEGVSDQAVRLLEASLDSALKVREFTLRILSGPGQGQRVRIANPLRLCPGEESGRIEVRIDNYRLGPQLVTAPVSRSMPFGGHRHDVIRGSNRVLEIDLYALLETGGKRHGDSWHAEVTKRAWEVDAVQMEQELSVKLYDVSRRLVLWAADVLEVVDLPMGDYRFSTKSE